MSDPFSNFTRGLESPAQFHVLLTPNDAADLAIIPRVLFCLSAGTLNILDRDGRAIQYPVAAGQLLPISARRLMATGTTATVAGWW